MTIEAKDHYPKMATHELHRLMSRNKSEIEIWEREHALAKSRGIPAEIARIAARVQQAKINAARAEVSLKVRDQAWGGMYREQH